MSQDAQEPSTQQETAAAEGTSASEHLEGEQQYYRWKHGHPTQDAYEDGEYFASYGRVRIHEEMLKDVRRTQTYKDAIMKNSHLFQDKVVMDVGAGTGVLSCFAARAGARKVYAVEASDMAHNAELIVHRNGLGHIVQVVQGKLEDIAHRGEIPETVDIIISEWMGCFLIFESMIHSVLFARDTYLKPGGMMWPSSANIYLASASVDELYGARIRFWNDVHGLDMSPLIPFAQDELFAKPIRDFDVKPDHLISDAVCIRRLDMYTLTAEELAKNVLAFEMRISNTKPFHGFVSWFDVRFEPLPPRALPVPPQDGHQDPAPDTSADSGHSEAAGSGGCEVLSTSPHEAVPTHWKQDLFLIEAPVRVQEGDVVAGVVRVLQHQQYKRHWWVEFSFSVADAHMYRQYLF